MDYSITIVLKRDRLEDDFKVCNQEIACPIPLTAQILTFVENIVNSNAKSKELFIIKAPLALKTYNLYTAPHIAFKKEIKLFYLLTYDGDILEIEPKAQIF